jgi:mannose/fructose/N-acetylgalactosamine-specific phosphotransferase system component IID
MANWSKSEKNIENGSSVLTKRDIHKSWWLWWLLCESSHNFERLQALSFCLSLTPILKKLYTKKEDLANSLKRHLVFYNSQGIWGSIVNGITIALEEKKSQGHEISEEMITGMKTGLMGSFAGIGDSLDWGTFMPIFYSLFIPLAAAGSWVGAVAPVVIVTIITVAEGLFLCNLGYKTGANSALNLLQSGFIKNIVVAASVLGLFMMGGLAMTYVHAATPIKIVSNQSSFALQDILDKILKGLLPFLVVGGVYLYLEKVKKNYLHAVGLIVLVGFVLGAMGILG